MNACGMVYCDSFRHRQSASVTKVSISDTNTLEGIVYMITSSSKGYFLQRCSFQCNALWECITDTSLFPCTGHEHHWR